MTAPLARADITERIIPEHIQQAGAYLTRMKSMNKEAESHGIESGSPSAQIHLEQRQR
jgi:hypothetical protein